MMKKMISIFLAAAMTVSLAACGGSKKAEESTSAQSPIQLDINASEYVELGKYKGITIDAIKTEVTDEEVEETIENERYNYSEYKKTDKQTVEEGDTVNVSFTCTVGGEEIDDYSEDDYDIVVGMGDMIYGDDLDLEEAIKGAKVGSTVTVKGTFAEEEIDDDFAGKKAEFAITINYISEEVLPELTDAFVKENFDYNTVDEYRAAVRAELEATAESEKEEEEYSALWEEVVKNSKQIKDYPDDVLEQEKATALSEGEEMAAYFDMEVEEFYQEMYGMTVEEYAKDSIFRRCVLQLLVEAENIAPSEEDVDAMIEEEMVQGGYESVEDVLEYTTREEFKEQLTYERAMEVVSKNATIKQ